MTWAQQQRQKFIHTHLILEGWIGRKPIMEKFEISTPQASKDLADYQKKNPDAMTYDRSAKRYVMTSPSTGLKETEK